ncbi:class I SAM-dependent methyltransferase [Tenggerimyces flavus]|uniref:Class I SAM-dependent methyltransferase n=1 Tax=Tenggerimyces flavus TaxID=1708749 RepID=A0ABV7YEV0_9ACTN|nr:class I SAM-dependent methyltransferase [Tenggerimyces flavus]MBM7786772.1 SAM-dependent methyltransferase [Tenggerimyces flavus]
MDGGDPDGWSDVAADWSALWGSFPRPVWERFVAVAAVGAGTSVLDAGCGSGELLAYLASGGALVAGLEPAPGMAALARLRVPGAEIREASLDEIPWPDGSFEVATAVNALQFAEDGLRELRRVTRPGGRVAIANWAEAARNDVDVLEAAIAAAREEDVLPGGPLREAGGLASAFEEAGLKVVEDAVIDLEWAVPDDTTLVRGILLGEDAATMTELTPVVLTAARPFRTSAGGYRLRNAFRYAVGVA